MASLMNTSVIEFSWKLDFLGVLFLLLYVICLGTLIGTVYPRPFPLCDTRWSNSNINSIFFVSYSPYGVRYSPYGGIGLFTMKVFYI